MKKQKTLKTITAAIMLGALAVGGVCLTGCSNDNTNATAANANSEGSDIEPERELMPGEWVGEDGRIYMEDTKVYDTESVEALDGRWGDLKFQISDTEPFDIGANKTVPDFLRDHDDWHITNIDDISTEVVDPDSIDVVLVRPNDSKKYPGFSTMVVVVENRTNEPMMVDQCPIMQVSLSADSTGEITSFQTAGGAKIGMTADEIIKCNGEPMMKDDFGLTYVDEERGIQVLYRLDDMTGSGKVSEIQFNIDK